VFGYRATDALGLATVVQNLLPTVDPAAHHRAFSLATQPGQIETTCLFLDAGEDPNRFNPPGTHSHTPPIHQIVWNGHLEVVRLLLERGTRLDIFDTVFRSTPLGWAQLGGQHEIVKYLETLSPV